MGNHSRTRCSSWQITQVASAKLRLSIFARRFEMPKTYLSPELAPRNKRTLKVLGVCRISTEHQDARSLDAQEGLLRTWVHERYDGEIEFKIIASRGSGEILDRDAAIEIEEQAATCKYDLVIAEDLGRIYRRLHALMFCESCEDYQTRVVAINDHLDTGDPRWKMSGYFAVMRHEAYNVDTAKKIGRQLKDNFKKGGVVQTFQYGYIKPPGAKTDAEIRKDSEAENVYEKWFEILESGGSYSEVADWLNANHIPLGEYTRGNRWDCAMVSRLTRNPILKGVRQRNRKKSVRVNKTGRHKQVNASIEELLERDCPHLAFIDTDRFDRVIAMLKKRNSRYRRKDVDGKDPRAGIPKKRTRWPGQHLTCGCCGGTLEYGAHGLANHLICSNARDYKCWMSISVDGPKAKQKLTAAIVEQLKLIPEFNSELLAAIELEAKVQAVSNGQKSKALESEKQKLASQITRLMNAIKEFGPSVTVMAELQRLEQQQLEIVEQQDEIAREPTETLRVPSADEARASIATILDGILNDDAAAMRLIHQLIPTITVFPFRSVHGGNPVLRARFSLNLAAIDSQLGVLISTGHPWYIQLEVDLFDPTQRIRIREEVIELRATGMTVRKMADQLGVTLPVITQAVNLQKEMIARQIDDPYQPLTAPPDDYPKWRRHRHPRFESNLDQGDSAA
jgi:site-specific DNA recombinase